MLVKITKIYTTTIDLDCSDDELEAEDIARTLYEAGNIPDDEFALEDVITEAIDYDYKVHFVTPNIPNYEELSENFDSDKINEETRNFMNIHQKGEQ